MTKARTLADNFAADINGITAGTGITGGGTSGTVTVTNEMATIIDAKGDLVGGTGADTFARLAVGANGTVLTADSAETTGLKWTTLTSLSWTQVATGSFTGASVTISNLSGSEFIIYWSGLSHDDTGTNRFLRLQFNSDTGSNYYQNVTASTSATSLQITNSFIHSNTATGAAWITMAGNSEELTYVNGAGAASFSGIWTGAAAVTSITLAPSGGSFDAGTYYIYKR